MNTVFETIVGPPLSLHDRVISNTKGFIAEWGKWTVSVLFVRISPYLLEPQVQDALFLTATFVTAVAIGFFHYKIIEHSRKYS